MLKAMRSSVVLRRSFLLVVLLCVLRWTAAGAQVAAAPPATIYLVRHAEKLTDKRPDLAQQGFLRAALLPNLFLQTDGLVALPKPEFIFATARSKNSNRPFETVMPLSSALNVPISNDVLNENFVDLAKLLLGGQFAGKVVLVSWHHGTLSKFVEALGATAPYVWPETQFDRIWRIDYPGGRAKVTDLPQRLLPGDSK